jgi:tetratricopeptide (TPR) repeat protein
MSQLARRALAQSSSQDAVKLIDETLRIPMGEYERTALISALRRIGDTSPKARMLATVHQGLGNQSTVVDVDGWSRALEEPEKASSETENVVFESRLTEQKSVLESGDPDKVLELAEAFLDSAYEESDSNQDHAGYLFRDAHRTALEAERLGAEGWRLHTVAGLCAYQLGDKEEAFKRAEAAAAAMPPGEQSWNSMAVLEIFAEARRAAIVKEVGDKKEWDAWSKAFQGTEEWLTDLHAAYSVLERHPLSTDVHVVTHYDFLRVLGAVAQAGKVLHDGLTRFPDSWLLHDRLRGFIIKEKGAGGLEAVYEEMLLDENASPVLRGFAGYASIVAAEFYRRGGSNGQALAAYNRAIAHYESWIETDPDSRASADHFISLALAGRARLALESREFEKAVADVLASFERSPDSAGVRDGLRITPAGTAQLLLRRLKALEQTDLAVAIETALTELDPEVVRQAELENESPRRPFGGRGSMRRRRPQQRDG